MQNLKILSMLYSDMLKGRESSEIHIWKDFYMHLFKSFWRMQVHVKCNPKTADPKVKGRWRWWKVRNKRVRMCMHVCLQDYLCVCLSACVIEWVSELLGCIGILKRDWQGRSLLGEIVNRVEPVICSRQPWKGTADSQGSYWEFQRCCLTDLGLGPRHTEPASRACSRIHTDQCAFTFSPFSLLLFFWISFSVLTFLQAF